MSAIAFFDVDKTLLAVNSTSLWIRRELREGRVRRGVALRAAAWTLLYEMGFARLEKVIEDGVRSLAGDLEQDMVRRVEAFFHEELKGALRPLAYRAIDRHRRVGDQIALLTSSSNYLVQHVAREVDADHVLSNAFETDDLGRFTGLPVRPLCFGPGKLTYAQRLAAQIGTELDACTFYTDSYADLPVLERVGHPVAVHPDPRLHRVALRRGWPIEVWH